MADKKISELDQTLNLSDQADFPLSQDNGGEPTTFKAKLTQIAAKIAEAITFSNLKTGNKQLVSAVNQTISNLADDFNTTAGSTYSKDDCVLYNGVLYQCINNSGTTSGTFIDADWTAIKAVDVGTGGGGGSSTFAGLSDVSIDDQTLTNGQVPVYNSATQKWENGNAGGGGASSADQVSVDDTDLAYEADDVQEALEKITKRLTYAEYEALTDAEKKNGTIYFITDVNGDGQSFQPVIYSEEEREIGVWIDGKPLYQKTLKVAPIALSNGTTIPHGVSDLEILVDAFIVLHRSNGEFYMPYTSTYKNTSNFIVQDGNLSFVSTDSWTASDYVNLYATLKYTKSTDTAGSGTWTPQGVPAVHYSTEEQVIGTWIDGSTLYERTFVSTTAPTSASNWYYIELGDIEVVEYKAYNRRNSGAVDMFDENGNDLIGHIRAGSTASVSGKIFQYKMASGYYTDFKDLLVTIRYTKSNT